MNLGKKVADDVRRLISICKSLTSEPRHLVCYGFQKFFTPALMKALLIISLCAVLFCGCRTPVDPEQIAEATLISRQYRDCKDPDEKKELAKKLARYDRHWKSVVDELRPRSTTKVKHGYYPAEHFQTRQLREKHPDDLLYLAVPSSYRPGEATGLVVFLHGGGGNSPRTAPAGYMTPGKPDDSPNGSRLGEIFEAAGMIGVGPSAPWNDKSNSRWCLPESDAYVADVIEECKGRYSIDADRVFLVGHSMGAFGAYQMAQTQPDRFAGIVAVAGSWGAAHWPALHGTDFCIVHGVKDAEPGVRDRHTDISFGRWADRMLTKRDVPHSFVEHAGGHDFGWSKPGVLKYLQASEDIRRDPFFPRVSLATPAGHYTSRFQEVKHRRWISLEATTPGEIEYDGVEIHGRKGHSKDSAPELWNAWELKRAQVKREGALIEAAYDGDNRFNVTMKNVRRFSLWLHPMMVDFDQPVTVMVNGTLRTIKAPKPSLATVLDSYDRRRDWGMVYPAVVSVAVGRDR